MTAMMTRAAALILAVASLTFTSCKKDKSNPGTDPGNGGGNGQTKKLTRIEENGQNTVILSYNADGSLQSLLTDYGQFGSAIFNFTYNEAKKVSEVITGEGQRIKYIYEAGTLVRTETYDDGEKVAENRFEYEAGKMKVNTLYGAQEDGNGGVTYVPSFKTIYAYAGSNIQKISTYILNRNGQLQLDNEYVYQQYDGKKNPLWVIAEFSQTFLYQPVALNNPLTEKLTDANGVVDESTVNEYTYDDAGYPVTLKATSTSAGSTTPTVRTVKFFY